MRARSTFTRARCYALLRPGGLLLNHAIAALDPDHEPHEDIFSTRYVFPDGEPLPLSRIAARARARRLRDASTSRASGRTTRSRCATGAERLDEHLEEAEALAGEQRTRIWRLYLRAARHGFETGHTSVYQVLARKPDRPA